MTPKELTLELYSKCEDLYVEALFDYDVEFKEEVSELKFLQALALLTQARHLLKEISLTCEEK